jgi:serine/threonine protein phosphatase PrpC
MDVAVGAATDTGIKRQLNEDCYARWAPEDPEEFDRTGLLLILADGMGGARAGEVASRVAVYTVLHAYREAMKTQVSWLEALKQAVEAANDAVHEENRCNPDLRQMGTTCTAAAIRGRDLLLAHVGDCRAYRIRKGRIEQLTRDHSLVAQLVEQKAITPEEARVDPRRNLITRSLGQNPEVKVDIKRFRNALGGGDTLLLCSDGLHGVVEDEELAMMVSGRALDDACEKLVALANERGGPDNITLVLARPDGPEIEEGSSNSYVPDDDDLELPDYPEDEIEGGHRGDEQPGPRHYPAWLLAVALILVVLVMYVVVTLQP